ncbi:MAG TPA: hypothetical protein VMB51_09460 [Solirubrobacteraceae bacterium]|nr:hypothetical protein [Solirubrobacteraceae bacterium]
MNVNTPLIDVAKQVVGLNADVGPLELTLEHRPKVLDPVDMNTAVHVGLGVVDGLVVETAL